MNKRVISANVLARAERELKMVRNILTIIIVLFVYLMMHQQQLLELFYSKLIIAKTGTNR
jgi:hypothetical protein